MARLGKPIPHRQPRGGDQIVARTYEPRTCAASGPLIILAPGRCFSSLICAMLGRHPRLYAIPEIQLLARDTMAEWLGDFLPGIHSHGLLRAVAEIVFGNQADVTIEAARRWLEHRRGCSTGEVLSELAAELAPLILVEKTPMVTYRPEHMQRAALLFPRARFLHLARHPAGYGRSLLEFFRRRAPLRDPQRLTGLFTDRESIFHGLYDASADPPDFDPQYAWFLRHSEVLAFTASLPPEQSLLVRAEELLGDPERGLREICDWLGLPASADMIEEMQHPEHSPFARLGPRNARFGGDPNFLVTPVLRPFRERMPRLDAPMPWSVTGAPFSKTVRSLATRLGYM